MNDPVTQFARRLDLAHNRIDGRQTAVSTISVAEVVKKSGHVVVLADGLLLRRRAQPEAAPVAMPAIVVALKTVPVFTRAQREAEALRLEIARRDLMARGSKGGSCGVGTSNGPALRARLGHYKGARA